jgi:hypothetical protein
MAMSLGAHSQGNGCGTGWNSYLVPDRIPILNCDFGSSCNKHDACYSACLDRTDGDCEYRRCRKGGDLDGSSRCLSDVELLTLGGKAQARRATCDADFFTAMRTANRGKFACEALAYIYRDAVKWWGDSAFAGFGFINPPTAWEQSQDEYNKAIGDFFGKANVDDFRRFVEAADAGKPTVNLCGRLTYSPVTGLTNVSAKDRNATCK